MTSNTIIVATPNPGQRSKISELVDALPDFKVIACTGDLMNTYNQVEARSPTAVLISDSLANLAEFEVMRALFSTLDVRWLVLTAPNKNHRSRSARILGSDLFSVPSDADPRKIEGQLRSLTLSGLKRTPPAKQKSQLIHAASKSSAKPNSLPQRPSERRFTSENAIASLGAKASDAIIMIGASTGGVDALLSILSSFPANCPPTMIVQHTGAGFGESLAGLLDRQCAATVTLSKTPQPLRRGTILIGAGTRTHLVLENGQSLCAKNIEGRQVSGHMPSVDVFFKSAVAIAPQVTAAILTGMGKDGAEGMLELRNAGATTYAQDEASSVVFGMPRAAIENGAAQITLPIDKIGPALLRGPQHHSPRPRKVLS